LRCPAFSDYKVADQAIWSRSFVSVGFRWIDRLGDKSSLAFLLEPEAFALDVQRSGMVQQPVQDGRATLAEIEAGLAALEAFVPVPAAVWLFGSGLNGLMAVGRRRRPGR